MKKINKLSDVPGDVLTVWAYQVSGCPIGQNIYNMLQNIIKKYPDWFPFEAEYRKIPEEVHEAYHKECYPHYYKPLKLWDNGDEEISGPGILPQTEAHAIDLSKPITIKDIEDCFKAAHERGRKAKEDQDKEERRKMIIWKKHYGKYKLSYPKKYSFEL